jgi:hypothetical protein
VDVDLAPADGEDAGDEAEAAEIAGPSALPAEAAAEFLEEDWEAN